MKDECGDEIRSEQDFCEMQSRMEQREYARQREFSRPDTHEEDEFNRFVAHLDKERRRTFGDQPVPVDEICTFVNMFECEWMNLSRKELFKLLFRFDRALVLLQAQINKVVCIEKWCYKKLHDGIENAGGKIQFHNFDDMIHKLAMEYPGVRFLVNKRTAAINEVAFFQDIMPRVTSLRNLIELYLRENHGKEQ